MLNLHLPGIARLARLPASWLGIAIVVALVVPVATLALSPPTATPGSDTTLEDTAKVLTLSGTDPDGDTLSFMLGAGPSTGQLGSITFAGCTGSGPSTCTATVTYTPDPDTNGADSFTFTVNDGGFTSAAATFDVTVTAVNDAPVLANTPLSITVLEDAAVPSGAVGSLVGAFTGGIADVDSGASKGIAVTGLIETNGTWYFSTNSGTAWSVISPVSGSQSLLLADNGTNRLYFRPAANYNGTSSGALTFRAWDQSDGGTPGTKSSTSSNGGATAFSTATDVIDAVVTAVNDAPVLANTPLSITVLEDAAVPSGAVGSLVGAFTGGIADVDSGASKGIAVTGLIETNGTWYFSTNSGTAWSVISPVSGSQSLLLADNGTNRLYFRPAANYNGTSSGALTFRAWDQSDGGTPGTKSSTSSNGGATAFSTATDVIDAVVTAVNDAPSFTKGANQVVLEDAAAQTVVGWATNLSKGPADESSQTLSFNVSNTNNGLFSAQPAVSSTGTLTYTPAPNANGSATVTISIMDSGGVLNGGVNVSANQTFTITVTAVDDPPTAANDVGKIVSKNSSGTVINVLANDTILPDSGETLTITAKTNGSHGTVTITGGGTTVTYVPNFAYVGSDSFTYTIKDSGSPTASDTATVLLDVVEAGTVTRLSGVDRYATSAAISQANFLPNVPVVYIATGLGFPDALSGAPVAGIKGGPILLVPGATIPSVIATELTRLKPAKIVILGGPSVVSANVAALLQNYTLGTVTRLSGVDRYATSAAISQANFLPNVPVVYIATGLGFPDALSGAPVAGIKGGPILLVPGATIPSVIATELTRLKPAKIVMLGGPSVVSANVAALLQNYTLGTVTRLSGVDRYATSAAISQANFLPNVPVVYIATGLGFPDALSGAPVAGIKGGPILLVPGATIPSVIAAELTRLKPAKIVMLGGPSVVSANVAALLQNYTTGP